MSFVTESSSSVPAGDRSFATASPQQRKRKESDIPGYEQELDDEGNPVDSYVSGESTGTRSDALQQLAKNEGVANLDEAALEELLKQVRDRKARKAPAYEPKVERPGVK